MSILVKFSKNSILYPTPSTLVNKKFAIAIEGLRYTFDTLVEVSERLEYKIVTFTKERRNSTEFHPRESSAISTDIWIMIDNFRRVLMLANAANIEIPADVNGLLKKAKDFRDSFHHLEERIPDFFISNSISVYGDYYWFNRFNLGEDETYNVLTTSSVKGDNHLFLDKIRLNTKKLKQKTGVYNLNVIHAIRRQDGVDKDNNPKYISVQSTLCIDDVASKINKFISQIESFFIKKFKPIIEERGGKPENVFDYFTPYFSFTTNDSEEHNFDIKRKR